MIDIDSRSTVAVLSTEEINRNLFRRRISKEGKSIESAEPNYDDPMSVVQDLKKALDNDEQCNMKGRIKLNRVYIAF